MTGWRWAVTVFVIGAMLGPGATPQAAAAEPTGRRAGACQPAHAHHVRGLVDGVTARLRDRDCLGGTVKPVDGRVCVTGWPDGAVAVTGILQVAHDGAAVAKRVKFTRGDAGTCRGVSFREMGRFTGPAAVGRVTLVANYPAPETDRVEGRSVTL